MAEDYLKKLQEIVSVVDRLSELCGSFSLGLEQELDRQAKEATKQIRGFNRKCEDELFPAWFEAFHVYDRAVEGSIEEMVAVKEDLAQGARPGMELLISKGYTRIIEAGETAQTLFRATDDICRVAYEAQGVIDSLKAKVEELGLAEECQRRYPILYDSGQQPSTVVRTAVTDTTCEMMDYYSKLGFKGGYPNIEKARFSLQGVRAEVDALIKASKKNDPDSQSGDIPKIFEL